MAVTAAGLRIRRAPLESQAAAALIAALNREISAIYPEDGATHFRLDAREVEPGRGAFLVARLGGRACGCGAVRSLGAGTAEIKRMYVAPEARGRGIGTALLRALEAEARALGAARLVLETGERQRDAVALYRRAGFTDRARFGEYARSPFSLCMEKVLAPARIVPATGHRPGK